MIQPLRRRHHFVFTVLGVLIPVALVLAIASRAPIPRVDQLPAMLEASTIARLSSAAPLWEREDLWEELNIAVALHREREGTLTLSLQPLEDLLRPDVLVYWAPGKTASNETAVNEAALIETALNQATLLGPLAGVQRRDFGLPAALVHTRGRLLLYSHAHGELLAPSAELVLDGERER